MPAFRPRGDEPSGTQGAESKTIDMVRISIGHSNARVKALGSMKGQHHGKSDRLGKTPAWSRAL